MVSCSPGHLSAGLRKVLIGLGILFGIFLAILGALLLFLRLLLPKGRGVEFYIPRVSKDFYTPRVGKDFYIPNLDSLLLKAFDFVERNPEIKEFDLNPIFAYGDGDMVVDAGVILQK